MSPPRYSKAAPAVTKSALEDPAEWEEPRSLEGAQKLEPLMEARDRSSEAQPEVDKVAAVEQPAVGMAAEVAVNKPAEGMVAAVVARKPAEEEDSPALGEGEPPAHRIGAAAERADRWLPAPGQ